MKKRRPPRNSFSNSHQGENLRKVIGLHASREVLKVRPQAVKEIWLKEGAERNHELASFINFAKKYKISIHIKKETQMNQVAPSHQGVCLYVSETPDLDLASLGSAEGSGADSASPEKTIILALDEISDPHNVGAVLRTAWLLGAKCILVPQMRAAHLTPATIKVASGGAEHVPLVVVDQLASALTYLKSKGFWIYGLSAEGSSTLWQTRFHEKVVLVIGSEDKGLRSTTSNVCDELVSIPQTDGAASFNASVAAALVLYEVVRQHKNP